MPENVSNPASWTLTRKIAAVSGFVVAVAGLIGAINAVVTNTKPWACMLGFLFSSCDLPKLQDRSTWSAEIGGPGGKPFGPLACGAPQVLVGIYGNAINTTIGPFIFSVGPICAVPQFDRKHNVLTRSSVKTGDEVGSQQGSRFELSYPENTVVVGSEMYSADMTTNFERFTYLVAPLTLRCSAALNFDDASSVRTVSSKGDSIARASRLPFMCPSGNAGFGIKGQTGELIDARVLVADRYIGKSIDITLQKMNDDVWPLPEFACWLFARIAIARTAAEIQNILLAWAAAEILESSKSSGAELRPRTGDTQMVEKETTSLTAKDAARTRFPRTGHPATS
jgi:hypothetical protein